jgi:serine protease Do
LKIGMMEPNVQVNLKVLRDGKTQNVAVQLGEFPSKEERAAISKENPESALQGVTVENLTSEVSQQLKLPATTTGVVVDEVSPASRAADAGLRSGDVIQEVNHQPVKTVQDFSQTVSASKKDAPVLLLVDREGSTMFLAV